MKRWWERSRSLEHLGGGSSLRTASSDRQSMYQTGHPAGYDSQSAFMPDEQPKSKKARQSTGSSLKQNVKRLFRSVRKIFPSTQKKQPDDLYEQPMASVQVSVVKKSAAMMEAEGFLERLGPDWTVGQVRARIDYVWKLVDDAFERAYLGTRKTGVIVEPTATVQDYMREIANLKGLISTRQSIIDVQEEEEVAIILEEPIFMVRSSSADMIEKSPLILPFEPSLERNEEATATTILSLQPISEGIIYAGVINDIYLSKYNLSKCPTEENILLEQGEEMDMCPEPAVQVVNPKKPLLSRFSSSLSQVNQFKDEAFIEARQLVEKHKSFSHLTIPRSSLGSSVIISPLGGGGSQDDLSQYQDPNKDHHESRASLASEMGLSVRELVSRFETTFCLERSTTSQL